MDERQSKFPKDFWWGASTAAHQVEGGNHNQWTVWELATAKSRAQRAHYRYSHLTNWHEIKAAAEDPNNYISGAGVDHYNRYKEDFATLGKLHLNAFRFSVEWSRIEPEEGRWDQDAIDHYKQYIAELRKHRIEPFLNVWHWTVPVWFAELGGFEKRANIKYFERFVQKIARELVDDVAYVITINEPNVYATNSYIIGLWPPEVKNFYRACKVYWNLRLAHKKAYKALKKHKPSLEVGMAAQLANIQAKRPHNFFDELATKFMRYVWNWFFLNRIKRQQDFIGLNYYFSDYYKNFAKKSNPKIPLSDLGWYMEPEGLYPILLRTWSHYKKPIIITESGLADSHDQNRRWWLEESLVAMEKAISEGVGLKGYFYWSLLDNFEWAEGWWPKFGLVKVDRSYGMRRTLRPSAKWLGATIKKIRKT